MGAFKLGKMTFGSLFKKPETVLYPFEKKAQPAGLKGHIEIDAALCILCGMCDRSCTTNCITVDRAARTWEINPYQCVQCGYCVTVCPKKCLSMNPNYWAAAAEIARTTVEIPAQEKDDKPKAAAKQAQEKPASAGAAKADAGKPEVPAEPEMAVGGAPDAQLERLVGLMDDASAEKVRAALG